MGWSIKKPLGGKNSLLNNVVKHPGDLAMMGLDSGLSAAGVAGLQQGQTHAENVYNDTMKGINDAENANQNELSRLATEEEAKRRALGLKQQGQINTFADEMAGRGADFRKTLAASLAGTAADRFNQLNPAILEDLNSRGLFTSQTARDKSQADALKSIALSDQNVLNGFDQNLFNDVNDIRGTALSATLGGDQAALDTALSLKKAKIQQGFDQTSQQSQMAFAQQLAAQQQKQQLISSLLGLGGSLGGGLLAGL